MLLGALRAQLLYPQPERIVSDDQLLQLLAQVNCRISPSVSGGFDIECDWEKVLFGERQRLAFARALLVRPRYAILDEATSALDVPNEDWLYRQLAETGATLVSVSHRSSILKYHAHVLELTGDSSWQSYPLPTIAGHDSPARRCMPPHHSWVRRTICASRRD